MKLGLCVAIGIAALLAGCDGAAETMADLFPTKPLTIVMPPGYEIAVDGKAAKVFGRSECPKEDASMRFLFWPSSLDGSSYCLVITPTTKVVLARVVIEGNPTDEAWTVERSEEKHSRVGLRRPGGLPVIAYDAFPKANPNAKDMRSQTLALNAKGCVAGGPDGNPLQLPEHLASGQVLIPKGSTFTAECFHQGREP